MQTGLPAIKTGVSAIGDAFWIVHESKAYSDWGFGFLLWHSAYFSICVWIAIFLMQAPRMLRPDSANSPSAGAKGRRRSAGRIAISILILSILVLSLLAGCGGPFAEKLEAVDYWPLPGGDWPVSTLSEQGVDPKLVA
jgi:hypothetical protein